MGKVLKTVATATLLVGATVLSGGTLFTFAGPLAASIFGTATIASAALVAVTVTTGALLALGSLSKMLAPKNKLDSGQELRSPIRSATPPRLTAYGEVSLPGVRAFSIAAASACVATGKFAACSLTRSPPWLSVAIFAATHARWASFRCRRFRFRLTT